MDTLTLTHGNFHDKFIKYFLIQNQNYSRKITLDRGSTIIGKQIQTARNARVTSVIHPEVQALIGQWIIKIWTRNGNTFKKPQSLVDFIQGVGIINYIFNHDQSNEYKYFKQHLQSKYVNFKILEKRGSKLESTPNIPTILASEHVKADEELEIITPDEFKALFEMCRKDFIDGGTKGAVLFELGIQGLENDVHQAIVSLSQHMSRMRITSPGLGLDHTHPYVSAMFLRPLPNVYLNGLTMDRIKTEFLNNKGKIALVGTSFAKEIVAIANSLKIPIVKGHSEDEGTIIRLQYLDSPYVIDFYSYLKSEVFEYATKHRFAHENDPKAFLRVLAPTFYPVAPCPQPILTSYDSQLYKISFQPSVRPYTPGFMAEFILTGWLQEIYAANVKDSFPIILGVIGSKGGLKSTVTKILVDCLSAQCSDQTIRFGRVDSDAYGKWVKMLKDGGSGSVLRTWEDFDRFQNDKSYPSYIEEMVQNYLKEDEGVKDAIKKATPEAFALSEWLAVNSHIILGKFSYELPALMNDKTIGYKAFVTYVMSLDDVPVGLIWEAHCSFEVAFLPPTTHIFTLVPPYDSATAVRARGRSNNDTDLVASQAEIVLHGLYTRLCAGNVYTRIPVSEVCCALRWDPVSGGFGSLD